MGSKPSSLLAVRGSVNYVGMRFRHIALSSDRTSVPFPPGGWNLMAFCCNPLAYHLTLGEWPLGRAAALMAAGSGMPILHTGRA